MDIITYTCVSKQWAAVIAYLSLMITFVHVPESDESESSCCGTTWSFGFTTPTISDCCLLSPHAAID